MNSNMTVGIFAGKYQLQKWMLAVVLALGRRWEWRRKQR